MAQLQRIPADVTELLQRAADQDASSGELLELLLADKGGVLVSSATRSLVSRPAEGGMGSLLERLGDRIRAEERVLFQESAKLKAG